jgi:hypothetical protein
MVVSACWRAEHTLSWLVIKATKEAALPLIIFSWYFSLSIPECQSGLNWLARQASGLFTGHCRPSRCSNHLSPGYAPFRGVTVILYWTLLHQVASC